MSGVFDRNLLSHTVIILAVCIGSWLMFVKPRADRCAEIEQAIAESASAGAMDETTVEQMVETVSHYRSRIEALQTLNAVGRNTSRLYGRVSDIADTHEVEIVRLEPGRTRRTLAGGGGSVCVLDITARGSFANVTQFIDDIENMPGFLRPSMLTMTPGATAGNPAAVDVRVSFEMIEFNLPEIMRGMPAEDEDYVDA